MRPRISKGTLVGSTNSLRKITSKRLVIEVLYNFKKGVVREIPTHVRTSLEQ